MSGNVIFNDRARETAGRLGGIGGNEPRSGARSIEGERTPFDRFAPRDPSIHPSIDHRGDCRYRARRSRNEMRVLSAEAATFFRDEYRADPTERRALPNGFREAG